MIAYGQTITNEAQLQAIQRAQANLLAATAPQAPKFMGGYGITADGKRLPEPVAMNLYQRDVASFRTAQQSQQQQFNIQQQQFNTELAKANSVIQNAQNATIRLIDQGIGTRGFGSPVLQAEISALQNASLAIKSQDLFVKRAALARIAGATNGRVNISF
jgi:hypothetical protein